MTGVEKSEVKINGRRIEAAGLKKKTKIYGARGLRGMLKEIEKQSRRRESMGDKERKVRKMEEIGKRRSEQVQKRFCSPEKPSIHRRTRRFPQNARIKLNGGRGINFITTETA